MDPAAARREAESAKYRLRLMLLEIERASDAPDLRSEVERLGGALRNVQVLEDEVETRAARDETARIEADVLRLAQRADVHFARAEGRPKWALFLLWTGPVLAVLLAIGVLFERRRRKAGIDQASVDALDASARSESDLRRSSARDKGGA
jgi:hypothetical protein